MRYLIAALLISFGDGKKIPCPLKWESATGVSNFPSAVATSISRPDNYIIRSTIGGRLVVGNFPTSLQFGLVPTNTGGVTLTDFEVLTNPHSCLLSWEIESDDEFSVKVGPLFVARASYGGKLIAGHVDAETGVIVTPSRSVVALDSDFQYLTSFLPGLRLNVGDLVLTHPPIVPTYELVGMDDILNYSPAVVKQAIQHKSRSYESVSVTTWGSWYTGSRFRFQGKVGLSVPIWGIIKLGIDVGLNINDENDEGGSQSKSTHKAVTKDIIIGREITVDPWSSVQACSIVINVKDFKANYTAVDTYSAPGLTGPQVKAHLVEDSITGGRIEGNTVILENAGTIEADFFVTTRFFVKPYESGTVCAFQ